MNFKSKTLLLCLLCYCANLSAQNFRVQLSAFTVKVPPSYFSESGFKNVYNLIDQFDIYRYYYGNYDTKAEADSIRNLAISRGFRYAQVIDMKEQEGLCGKPCPLINELDIYIDPSTEELYVKHIFFGFDSATLRQKANIKIDKIHRVLQTNEDYRLQIIGHADHSGPAEYNLNLSKRRARTVRNYLIAKGIKESRIFIKVYGESAAFPPSQLLNGKKPEQYARRVTLAVLNEDGQIMTEAP